MNIQKILEKHELYLQGREGGERANLQGADLYSADLSNVNLYGANLYGSRLSNANLEDAYLEKADLRHASLMNANLQGANLRSANLIGVDLRNADLRGASLSNTNLNYALLVNTNLEGANLWNCRGNSKEIITMQTPYYTVNLTKDFIQIGCERHTLEEWQSFSNSEIKDMAENALKFWNGYKNVILTSHRLAFGGNYE